LSHYFDLLQSPPFLNSLKVTLLFLLVVNPLQIGLALFLSVALIQKVSGAKFLRTVIFLPVAVPPAVTALVWGLALRPDGVINSFLSFLNLPPQPLLTSSSQALGCIIVMLSWAGIGYWMVFLIAALKEIPTSLLEAGVLDGASWWTLFTRIMLPLMRKTLAFVLVANTVANFIIFAHVQVLTKGGPSGSTDLIMYQIYRQVFQYDNSSSGAAQTTILMLVILSIVMIEYRILSRE
jgi:multiple sugar transport system permease protein